MSWWGQSPFDEVVEKATSELLPGGQEDLVLNLDISDQIRSKKINAKDAMRSFKRRLQHKNPNVQLATLSLVDTCVKNGGDIFVKEIASREFMDELVSILKAPTGCNVDVQSKLLYCIQTWGLASKNKPVLSYMYDTYALLKAEGHPFPPINENIDGILLETAAAPEWSDSDVCDRCRTAFTMTNRKHHCRKCGGTFCQQCSAKTMPLPQLGINESVRVCDGCYIKLKLDKATMGASTSTSTSTTAATTSTATTTTNATSNIAPKSNTSTTVNNNNADDFDDDMKKAIELSLKEAEQQKNSFGTGYVAPVVHKEPEPQRESVEDDPDLAAAIAASLRDIELSKEQPTIRKDELSPVEMENILLFSTLMDRVYASGGDISNDTQINQLYTQIGTLQPKLVKNLDEIIRKRNNFIALHEKLNMAVKAYDRLLEERIAGVRLQQQQQQQQQEQQTSYYNIPEQHYQQQRLYHQQQYNHYQQQPQDLNKYYSQQQPQYSSNQPITTAVEYPSVPSNQGMNNYYSAPPLQYQAPSPGSTEQQPKKPVDDAPLIDL